MILSRNGMDTDINNCIFNDDRMHKDRDWLWGLNKFNEIKKYLQINNKLKIQKLFSLSTLT